MRKMKKYFSIFKIKTAETFQYRMAALSGSTISIFYALTEIIVYSLFYIYSGNKDLAVSSGLTLTQMITYVWIGQLIFIIQPFGIDSELHEKITNGNIGIELCRPIDFYYNWFFKTAAGKITPLVWRGIPIIIAGFIMPFGYRMSLPYSGLNFIIFIFALICAALLCTSYGMLINTIRMNITWGDGPIFIFFIMGGILSGSYLPLQLWPDFMQTFLRIQPFAGFLDTPARVYIGNITMPEMLFSISLQLFWSLLFIIAGKTLSKKQLRKLVVQGG